MAEPAGSGASRDIYTVSRLLRAARSDLESAFPSIWVEGELSNLARPASGHLYFSLKDAAAQVRCAMFRNRNLSVRFRPENGMQVVVRGRVSLYEARGEFQLIVEQMEEAGDGALRRAFEMLKQRLAAEGLFDEAIKKPLPALPRRIGIITSPTGAAIRDILSVLARRFPLLPVLVHPVVVQGTEAAPAIVEALETANRRAECDVLILSRGGGSLEDLQPFNEERVARAIRASGIPVISGVGHEIDVTIADFAADRRAPTPSAAAELVSPDRQEWLDRIRADARRLERMMESGIGLRRERLDGLGKRLQHPGRRLQTLAQRLDDLEHRLRGACRHLFHAKSARLSELTAHLQRQTPTHRLRQLQERRAGLERRLAQVATRRNAILRERLGGLGQRLHTVSPLATLERGYAIAVRARDGQVLREAGQVGIGEQVQTRLGRGELLSTVDRVIADEQ